MKKENEFKSCIIGQAQVIFGGGVRVELATLSEWKDAFAICLSELKHPAAKAGGIPPSEDTFGIQVSLVFPNLETLRNFQDILAELEAGLKTKIKEREIAEAVAPEQ